MRRRLTILLPNARPSARPAVEPDDETRAIARAWDSHIGQWLAVVSAGKRIGQSRVTRVGSDGVHIEALLDEGVDITPEDISLVTPNLGQPLGTRVVAVESPIVEDDVLIP